MPTNRSRYEHGERVTRALGYRERIWSSFGDLQKLAFRSPTDLDPALVPREFDHSDSTSLRFPLTGTSFPNETPSRRTRNPYRIG